MSEILGNIYGRSIAIVFGTAFFWLFLEIVEKYFLTKHFSTSYIYIFFLSKKTAELVLEKRP